MTDFSRIPDVLKRRLLLTFLAGIGAATVSLVLYLTTGDRILLILGGILLVGCIFRGKSCWDLIASKSYETTEGICTGITPMPFRRYRKVHLLDKDGEEFALLLDTSARLHIGASYRFYFRKNARPLLGNAYLDASLSTNAFLGYEELSEEEITTPTTQEK